MKKIILIIFIFILTGYNQAFCGVAVTSTGGTTINATQVSTPIQVVISVLLSLSLTMKVKALDQYITNTTNPTIQIPVSNLYLNDGTNNFQMVYNTQVTTINGLAIGLLGYTVNYNCIIKNIGVLPPGTYTTRLQFDTNTTLSPDTTVYTLSFTIPLTQSVTTTTNPVNITLTQANVFDANASVANTVSPQVKLQTNNPWKLILDTTGMGTLKGNYYFTITSATSNVTSYITAQTQILPNTQYTLASGNATVTTPITGSYANDYITIQYLYKNASGSYIPEGTYSNNVTYSLQTPTGG